MASSQLMLQKFLLSQLLTCTQAVRKLLPNEQLRPYLPAATKQAWRMDKQSLRGIKRRRAEAAVDEADTEQHAAKKDDAVLTSGAT